ncbi:MAG: hypothetical protein FJW80_09545 [Actinobacteria bacterium]|nr:hypothetical protein [Actinomycetota bacterium]
MTSVRALHSPVHRLLRHARSRAITAVAEVRRWWRVVLAWHRQRLATDPLYPATITTAGGALIIMCVTSAHVAHLLRTALHLIAGHPVPHRHDEPPFGEEDPWWQ